MLERSHLCITLTLVTQSLFAQQPTGAIEGLLLSPSGSAVPGAAVTITEQSTGRAISISTNEAGRYSANNLLPGNYTVRVEAPGFQTVEIRDIPLNSGETYNGDLMLSAGKPDVIVTVFARASTVDTTGHTVRTVFTADEIRDFPMFGRNFLDLSRLAPGVSVLPGSVLDPTKAGTAYRAVSIAGRAGAGTRIQIDGIDVTDPIAGGTLINISAEAVQEFQISQSSLDASAPITSTGVVQIVGKSGGNDLHGSGFWTHYNQDMGARPHYEPDVLPFSRHQAGGSVGGPFVREKLFWFANAERSWQHTSITSAAVEFPQLRVTQKLPADIAYAKARLDWNLRPSVRTFGTFLHDWNLTSGGGATSPYRNVNWSNALLVGLEVTRPATNYSYRFGFTNFNNRIESRELAIPFPRTPSGGPFFLSVGRFTAGPNSMAPQATGTTTVQNHFAVSLFRGRQTLRAGASVDRIVAAVFLADQRLSVAGIYNTATLAQVQARGGNIQDPTEFPLSGFSVGTGLGYPFLRAGHGFPFGSHNDTRTALYAVHSMRWKKLALTTSLRWNYATGYFPNDDRIPRHPAFERWISGASAPLRSPRDLFSPQFGFSYDPLSKGKTVIRGGFLKTFERPLVQNLAADQMALLPAELGSGVFSESFVAGPDGRPIDVDGHPRGQYTDLLGRPIRDVIGTLGRLHQAVHAAYASHVPSPRPGNTAFEATQGFVGAFFPGSQYRPPYSLQFNIGVQQELFSGTVLTVDYVRNHGIGLPVVVRELELSRDASTLDTSAARNQMNRVLGGLTLDQWINANPRGTIANFGLVNDQIWTGITPDYLGARFIGGGFSLYRALQVSVRGTHTGVPLLRNPVYVFNYALSRSEATISEDNPEQLMGARSRDWNSRSRFGPTPLDVTHSFNGLITFTAPGGLRLTTQTFFRTASPLSIALPSIGATSGVNFVFGTDLNGDHESDFLPGVNAGQFGRDVKSLSDLNRYIDDYNTKVAGRLTAHGQALVRANLLTEDQMRHLGGVSPAIAPIPEGNPSPWNNIFTTNLRVYRPVRLEWFGTVWQFGPFADIFNLFNHAPSGVYSGLSGLFGSLNFDYANAPPGRQLPDLTYRRGRIGGTRQFQIGVRLDF